MKCNHLHRRYLTQGEVLQVATVDLSAYPELVIGREYFMAQCATGQTYARMRKVAKTGGDAQFLAFTEAKYAKCLAQIISLAGIMPVLTDGDKTITLDVTANLGRYTHLFKRHCHEQESVTTRTAARLEKEFGPCFFSARSYLTWEEYDQIEQLDLYDAPELFKFRELFFESCQTEKTVNRMITTRNWGSFSEPEFKKYADNDEYLRMLKILFALAGIESFKQMGTIPTADGPLPYFEVLEVTPFIGRNTFIAHKVEPM